MVRMAVETTAVGFQTIVEMKSAEPLQADPSIELAHRGLIRSFRS